jgi:hypothetical protein
MLVGRLQKAAEALRGSLLVEPGGALDKLQLSWLHDDLPCVVTFVRQTQMYQGSARATCLQIRHPRPGKEYYLSQQELPNTAAKLPLFALSNKKLQLRSEDPKIADLCNKELLDRLCQLPLLGVNSDREAITLWLAEVITELRTITDACEVLSTFVQSSSAPYR